jgi:hypothetical protein
MDARIKVCIDAWDDPEFRAAFDHAYRQVIAEGLAVDSPEAAQRAQHLLVDEGYGDARIVLERSVEDALAHAASWSVHRGASVPVGTR